MGSKDRGPRWRCFGGTTHHFQLSPERELVEVLGTSSAKADDSHTARVVEVIERVTSERSDAFALLAEL
jgi:hypothetical protein